MLSAIAATAVRQMRGMVARTRTTKLRERLRGLEAAGRGLLLPMGLVTYESLGIGSVVIFIPPRTRSSQFGTRTRHARRPVRGNDNPGTNPQRASPVSAYPR